MTPSLEFKIFDVPFHAKEVLEQVGSKSKFWFTRDNHSWLFKEPNPGTGEDWAEVVAAELCKLLDLPHAEYEFAIWNNRRGTISPSFRPTVAHDLVLGNELLMEHAPTYPGHANGKVREHTIDAIFDTLDELDVTMPVGFKLPPQINNSIGVFIGYIIFDALIGNTDRHHQNWGVLKASAELPSLVPTFDHAASMGCILTDRERINRLTSKDMGYVVYAYSRRARSAFFGDVTDRHPMSTRDSAAKVLELFPDYSIFWISRVLRITREHLDFIFSRIPGHLASEPARNFAIEVILCNQKDLGAMIR